MALNVVGIVCALASEARHLGPTTFLREPLRSLADGTLVATTGMGSTAAAAGARALIEAGATALASWGMAGGLDPTLAAGEIVLPSRVVGADGQVINTADGWRKRLSCAIGANVPVRSGTLLTSARAIGSVADKADLFRMTGAAAVDMESLAIGEIAASARLPFISVRVIVDGARDVLPHAVTAAANKEGHLQIWRLMGALVRAPNELVPLIRLARRYRAANRSLARIARVGSLAPSAFSSAGDCRLS